MDYKLTEVSQFETAEPTNWYAQQVEVKLLRVNGRIFAYARFGDKLVKYELSGGQQWIEVFKDDVFFKDMLRRSVLYPWNIYQDEKAAVSVLLKRTDQGLHGYQDDGNQLKELGDSPSQFLDRETFYYSLESTSVIQLDANVVVTKNDFGLILVFQVNVRDGQLALEEVTLESESDTEGYWISSAGRLVHLNSGTVEIFAIDNKQNMLSTRREITLNGLAEVTGIERLMIASKKILHFTDAGLNVYDLATGTKLAYINGFAMLRGWSQEMLDTIIASDVLLAKKFSLLFTGPKGIGAFILDGSKGSFINFDQAGTVVGQTTDALITFDKDRLQAFTIEERPMIHETALAPTKTVQAQPLVLNFSVEQQIAAIKERQILWMHDTFDDGLLKNIVDKRSGKLQFSLPLFDFSERIGLPIKHAIYFEDKEDDRLGVVGRYWTFGKDCIVADYGDSIFPSKHSYFLIKDTTRIKLLLKEVHKNKTMEFEVAGNAKLSVRYLPELEQWQAVSDRAKYFYGKKESSDAVSYTPGWDNWRGPSERYDTAKPIAVQWNLVQIDSAVDRSETLKYTYEKVTSKSHRYQTEAIYVKKIDDETGTSVDFGYEDGAPLVEREESVPYLKRFKFHEARILKTVNISTPSFYQNLKLTHSMIRDVPYFTGIEQEGKAALQFDYEEYQGRPRLAKITLPSKAEVKYTYGLVTVNSKEVKKAEPFGTEFHSGPDYTLRVKKKVDAPIDLTIRDVSGRDDFTVEQPLQCSLSTTDMTSVQALAKETFLMVVVSYKSNQTKLLYYRKKPSGTWDPKEHILVVENNSNFQINALGDDAYYYANGELVRVFWDSEKWDRHGFKIGQVDSIKFLERGAVYHGDNRLALTLIDPNFNIMTHYFPNAKEKPNLKAGLASILNGIQLYPDESFGDKKKEKQAATDLEDYKRSLDEKMCTHSLSLYNNLLIFRAMELKENVIQSNVQLYSLDATYRPDFVKSFTIPGDDLDKFNITLDTWDAEEKMEKKYTFKFSKNNAKKYEVAVSKVEAFRNGKPTDQYDKGAQNQKNNIYRKTLRLPLDLEKYTMSVNEYMILYSDHRIYRNDTDFALTPVDRAYTKLQKMHIKLGDKLRLSKMSAEDTIKLYNHNSLVHDFRSSSARNVTVLYPVYLLQQKGNDLEAIKPSADGTKVSKFTIADETPHASSTPALLITRHHLTKETNIRPGAMLADQLPVVVITQEQVTNRFTPFEEFTNRYRYVPSSAVSMFSDVMFKEVHIAPGSTNDRDTPYGYYRDVMDFATSKHLVQVMNADGTIFDPEHLERMNNNRDEEEEDKAEPEDDPETVIYDRSRQLAIVKHTPYQVAENLVHYCGFEDYEDTEGWEGLQVVRDHFSATGRNFALVNRNARLTKRFTLGEAQDTFIVSAWLRTEENVNEGDKTDLLRLNAGGDSVRGRFLNQIDDWWYVEAQTKVRHSNVPVEIAIQASGYPIHVDHVRFSPLNFNFKANIYDPETQKRVAVIKNNGLVTRYEFDQSGKRAAEVGETGTIKYFGTYKKYFTQCNDPPVKIRILPTAGFAETFSPYTLGNYWTTASHFKFAPGMLVAPSNGSLTYNHRFESDEVAIRVICSGMHSGGLRIQIGERYERIDPSMLANGYGEVLMLFTSTFVVLWIDGCITHEAIRSGQVKNATLQLILEGPATLKNLFVMDKVQVYVTYLNANLKNTQEISLKDFNTISMKESFYDAIGRKVTETVMIDLPISILGGQLFKYNDKFVMNRAAALGSGSLEGLALATYSDYYGYPFSHTVYARNPLEVREKSGMPGRDYSVNGPYAITYQTESTNTYIRLRYPKEEGYRTEEEHKPDGAIHITVLNKHNKKMADFVKVRDFNDIITTYDYDAAGNQVQMLPPLYHEEVGTLRQTRRDAIDELLRERKISPLWECRSFFKDKLLINRTSPDHGLVSFIYNDQNQMLFQLHQGEDRKVDKINYYLYSPLGKIAESGILDPRYSEDIRAGRYIDEPLPPRTHFMIFDNGELESDPQLRGRILKVLKHNDKAGFTEALVYDENENVVRKSYLSPVNNQMLSLEYLIRNDNVHGIRYPIGIGNRSLELLYDHNLRGEVIAIKDGVDSRKVYARFDHDAQGKVLRIRHTFWEKEVVQSFKHNAPGFLTSTESEFIKETLEYESGGYGATGRGDGSMLRTTFHALWHDKCDQHLVPLRAEHFVKNPTLDMDSARLCYGELQRLKYLDDSGRPIRTFYPELHVDLPVKCSIGASGQHIAQVLMSRGFPEVYGHMYNYGSHGELTEAKGFLKHDDHKDMNAGDLMDDANQVDWQQLRTVISRIKSSRSYFENVNADAQEFADVMPRYLEAHILSGGSDPSLANPCAHWFKDRRSLIGKCQKVLPKFKDPKRYLNRYLQTLPGDKLREIFKLLRDTFATGIGRSAADVESFSIDKNGNHRLYYTGFKRFELKYRAYSNQIEHIQETFAGRTEKKIFVHDSDGSVIKATHKNIELIEYDPLSLRASKIVLTDGTTVMLSYNYKGERTIKKVLSPKGHLIRQLFYVRDHKGNTMVEYKFEYPNEAESQGKDPIVTETAYIYGPLGLLGFYRNNEYYCVLQDHEGSTRLVIKNNKVVAAYDYLPYGQLIRSFGADRDAHIAYRYTGQEYDEETDLYNYHARLYDPDIGRFYQCDPQEQYPSPYKYAGNSPVSHIDPDGEFAFLLILVFAAIGAYLGASAANNSFNPAKWDFSNKWTWINMFLGGLAGAFAVIGGVGAIGYFASLFGGSMLLGSLVVGVIAVAAAYLSAAGATGLWDPAKWDWTSPAVWNGLFSGVAMAVTLPTGVVGIMRTFSSLVSITAKALYAVFMTTAFVLLGYVGGAMANGMNFRIDTWDFKNPRTYFGVFEGVATIFAVNAGAAKSGPKAMTYLMLPGKMPMTRFAIRVPELALRGNRVGFAHVMKYYRKAQHIMQQASLLQFYRRGVAIQRMAKLAVMTAFSVGVDHISLIPAVTADMNVKYSTFFEARSGDLNKTFGEGPPSPRSDDNIEVRNVRQRRSAPPASSGASSFSNEYLKQFFDFMESFASSYSQADEIVSQYVGHPLKNLPVTSGMSVERRCISLNSHESQSFVCPAGWSTVNVFPKALVFESDGFGQDKYSFCTPTTWNGRPSVVCHGERSSFVYTPHLPTRAFDWVDGWILLASATPAAIKNIGQAISYIFGNGTTKVSTIPDISTAEVVLKEKLEALHTLLTGGRETNEYDWAIREVRELQNDIEELIASSAPQESDLVLLYERLEALQEDVEEIGMVPSWCGHQQAMYHDLAKEVMGCVDHKGIPMEMGGLGNSLHLHMQ